jgi:hypothetical protein
VTGWRESLSISYLPHLVVLADRASHARRTKGFRGTHGIRYRAKPEARRRASSRPITR